MKLILCQDLHGISMYPKLWEEAGISYAELLDVLLG